VVGRVREIVFDGYYGRRNTGDDAFCVVAADVAHRRWGYQRVAFVGPHSDLPALPVPARGLFPDPPRFRGHGRFAPVPAMLRSRRVVHVGGSTLTHRLTRQRDEARLARAGLVELHAVGVSIGPFANREDGREVAATLRRFASVSVRDTASLERAAEIGLAGRVTSGFDVAVLLPRVLATPDRSDRPPDDTRPPVLGVSVCPDESLRGGDAARDRRRQASVRDLVAAVAERTGATVRILVFNDHPRWGDSDVSWQLAAALDGVSTVEQVHRSRDVRHLLDAVASCDAVVGTRLHSAIFAYACGVPFALVAYQRKCDDFAAEVGLPDPLVFPAHGPDPADVDTVAALLDSPGADLRARLTVDEARDRADAAFPDLPAANPRTTRPPTPAGKAGPIP
jgi:polysaccharide pyruvyl transferase WcaK-like protein